MNHLASVVEAKTGSRPVAIDLVNLRSRLSHDIESIRSAEYDVEPESVQDHEVFNEKLEPFLSHPDFGRYLSTLTPEVEYEASGVRVPSLEGIREQIQECMPAPTLLKHGYMVFAVSPEDNLILFDRNSGHVVWGHSFNIDDVEVEYEDRDTGEYHVVPISQQSLSHALHPLSGNFITFLDDLLNDRLKEKLSLLDS